MTLSKVGKLFTDKKFLFDGIIKKLSPYIVDDKTYLSLRYKAIYGKKLNWNHPKLFAEKMQWLKVYNRKPQYTIMADKIKAKEWVAEKIGSEYIIPTLGIWERAEDINFDLLPDKFVLKCNHNSGTGMYICKDKNKMNEEQVRKGLAKGLKQDYYLIGREWPYKDIPRRIIAEQFMEDNDQSGDLADYKFFCFNGEPKYCQVIRDRSTNETIDFYDMGWNLMSFVGLNPNVKNGIHPVECPPNFKKMVNFCRILSQESPFTRVDFYIVNGKEYFGEITFFPMSGFGTFTPSEWNEKIGSLIQLDTF